MKRLHMWVADDMYRSVKDGAKITALCGRTKVVSDADVDHARNPGAKNCRACADRFLELARNVGATVRPAAGWEAFASDIERERTDARATVRVTGAVVTWHSGPTAYFPPAA